MKNLNNTYMAEMSQTEMQDIDGGMPAILPFLGGAILGGMIYDLVMNTEAVLDRCSKGRADANAKWRK